MTQVNGANSPVNTDYVHHDASTPQVEKALAVTDAHDETDKEFKDPLAPTYLKTKKFFCWRLTKRRWIAAVAGSVIVSLGVLLIILWFAVAVPLFQHNADKVHLSLNYMDIVHVEKGADVRTLGTNMSVRFEHHLSIGARSDPTTVTLLYEDKPFGTVEFPELHLKTGKQEYDLVITSDLIVSDADVFAQLSEAIITQKNLTIDAHTKLKAHALGLSKGGLKFDRTLALTGMNNYVDPPNVIERMTMNSCSSSALDITINATVTNTAQLGLQGIGALNLTLYFSEDYLGYGVAMVPELGVPRGQSTQMFHIFIDATGSHLAAVQKMVKGIASGAVQFFMRGDNPYVTDVGLLQEPIKVLNMSFPYADQLDRITFTSECSLSTLVGLL
uniref:Uncharacterized protein n=1 Tax=Globisporangium ultimum (strain ATCC 200006 / CBS 805.95 / DAOM BR144) TaxID=431595 RepID=K3WCT6_GLOUD